ncbi:MAG: nitroreductase family protein, partial [Spirochaetota bacterium]
FSYTKSKSGKSSQRIATVLSPILHRNKTLTLQKKKVPSEILDSLLDAGRLSPSVKNRQPWRFIAITDEEKKKLLRQACYGDPRCMQGALIAACYATTDYTMPNGFSANLFDLGLACGQIMLQAEESGLAAEALTSFSQAEAGRALTLPHGMYVIAIILLGYSADPEKSDTRLGRLPLERTTNYNSW